MKSYHCFLKEVWLCLPLLNGSKKSSKRIENNTGGTLADLWRNIEPINTTIQRYVQPMFSQLKLTVGSNRREGEERKRTPLLPSSASSLFSKGVKIGGTWNSLMLLGFAGFSVCMFRQCDWRNIYEQKINYEKCFSFHKDEKKIRNSSCFMNS